jgi:maleylpyruvate isomerase
LCDDVVAKRASAQPAGPALVLEALDTGGRWELPGDREQIVLSGPLAEIAAYLTGRAHKLTTAGGEPAPVLGPWL